MQIIIPMAGYGDRFKRAGYTVPKPLIEIEGRPMIAHVVDLFPKEDNMLFICNTMYLETTNMRPLLEGIKPEAIIVGIEPHKLGPVYTVMQVEKYIHNDEPVIVSYCDFSMRWNYDCFLKQMRESNVDGSIVSYKGFHPHLLGPHYYASSRVGAGGMVEEIKEKFSFTENKMDSWQSAGVYYFKSGRILKYYFNQLLKGNIQCNNEYFVSLVYNLLIRDRKKVSVYPVSYFCQWGTPEDMEEYCFWSDYFLQE